MTTIIEWKESGCYYKDWTYDKCVWRMETDLKRIGKDGEKKQKGLEIAMCYSVIGSCLLRINDINPSYLSRDIEKYRKQGWIKIFSNYP